ncbi:glycosyltransferase, partial [Salinivibrio sp. VYel4]|uniref:glycosyltransferase n=1 Tax=Salinivibrio sp. VYel4 TaxID=2490491 RepID=UPI001562A6FD
SLKAEEQLDYKIVFDPRSLWPEEMSRRYDSYDVYHYLKKVESYILAYVDAVVSVNESMTKHFRQLTCSSNNICETIYLSAPKSIINSEIPTCNNSFIRFCNIGSLTSDSLQTPHNLFSLFSQLKYYFSSSKLVLITQSNTRFILADAQKYGIESDEIEFRRFKDINDLPRLVNDCHFSLLSYRDMKNPFELELAKTGFATKSIEYISLGLPLIVNEQAAAISELVRKNNIGVVYGKNFSGISKEKLDYFLSNANVSERMKSIALNLFELEGNAKRYREVYNRIIK